MKYYAFVGVAALVLTAIVISFGMTAVIMIMAIGGYLSAGHDRIDLAARDDGDAKHDGDAK